jgi:NAD kinase
MELYIQNNNDNKRIFISKLWGDGLIVSSSFGSVSRSMVLNGPIIHKKVECFILTPICPLSLKFRPIVLPCSCSLIIKVEKQSRSAGTIYIDGIKTNKSI